MKKHLKLFYLLLFIIVIPLLLDSCHSTKRAARKELKAEEARAKENNTQTVEGTAASGKKPRKAKQPQSASETPVKGNAIADKYANLLGVSKRDITNYELYKFIDAWYATPYKYAGRTHAGVDCSDLASLLFQQVFDISISGNVTDIYKRCEPIKQSELKEGDLIFFKINSKSLSHVGIFLQNHKFVHASVHSGVVIDDLGEDYYRRYYWGAGRLIKN
jgi:murein DD-endopeptidase / murein LD-carboxypeptidase